MMEGISLEKKEGYAILSVDIPQTRNALSVPIVEYMDTVSYTQLTLPTTERE